jgi:hypothetical protein
MAMKKKWKFKKGEGTCRPSAQLTLPKEDEDEIAARNHLLEFEGQFEFEFEFQFEDDSQSRWATGYENQFVSVLQSASAFALMLPVAAAVLGSILLPTFSLFHAHSHSNTPSYPHFSLRNASSQNHTLTQTHDQHMSLPLFPILQPSSQLIVTVLASCDAMRGRSCSSFHLPSSLILSSSSHHLQHKRIDSTSLMKRSKTRITMM